jgi:hypothetical protein
MNQYSWKKQFFSSETNLYLDDTIIGNLTFGVFTKGYIELLGNTYTVKNNGIWSRVLDVYKNEEKAPIAKLTFSFWNLSTKIEYNNTVYEMVYRASIFSTHFNIYHQDKNLYTYDASKYRSYIETIEKEDPLLILLGLYCYERRRRSY